MKFIPSLLAAIAYLALMPSASAATIGGTYYAPQYDYSEFFAATDRRNFQVILAGDPLPGVDPNAVARDLLGHAGRQARGPRSPSPTMRPRKAASLLSPGAGLQRRQQSQFERGL